MTGRKKDRGWARRNRAALAAGPVVAHARASDPVTSHQAAASITDDQMREARGRVYGALVEHGPSADHEIAEHLDGTRWSASRLRTARKELVRMELVKRVEDVRRDTQHHRTAQVWEVAS